MKYQTECEQKYKLIVVHRKCEMYVFVCVWGGWNGNLSPSLEEFCTPAEAHTARFNGMTYSVSVELYELSNASLNRKYLVFNIFLGVFRFIQLLL